MMTIEDRIIKAKTNVAVLEHQMKVNQKKEREAKQKQDRRRNYIIGAMVTKYFPEVSGFQSGTQAENDVNFAPLEAFLAALANDHELIRKLKERANVETSATDKQECDTASSRVDT